MFIFIRLYREFTVQMPVNELLLEKRVDKKKAMNDVYKTCSHLRS